MPWTSAIVGSGVPLSVGIADALKRDKSGGIALVNLGMELWKKAASWNHSI